MAIRAIVVALLAALTMSSSPIFANAAEPAAANRRAQMLKTPAQLRRQLSDPHLRVLDVRGDEAFRAGHIPGAVRVDLNAWKARSLEPGGLHDADFWGEAIGKLGIGGDTEAVVYGDSITDAARAWWTLKYVGVEKAALLDGGWAAWTEAALPSEEGAVEVKPAEFSVRFQPERLMELDDLLASYQDDKVQVVDTRSAGEYSGNEARGPRGGRIPGAVHLEWKELLDDSGRFKSDLELKKLFAARGILPQASLITHCQSGGRASVNAFAFELAGYPPVKNYYCGWSEWSKENKAPVESSPQSQK